VPNTGLRNKGREARRRAVVLATPEGKIQFVDLTAQRWLKQFFGRPVRAGLLPRKLCCWLKQHGHVRSSSSFIAKQESVRLYLKNQAYTPQSNLLLLELINGKKAERSRRHHNLTPREREVLSWLVNGKTNAEIAAILGIKSATVNKHLERIYPKLGVENRAAAVSFASEAERTAT
jgi:DNA-binding CsgD family transcriptional regulator